MKVGDAVEFECRGKHNEGISTGILVEQDKDGWWNVNLIKYNDFLGYWSFQRYWNWYTEDQLKPLGRTVSSYYGYNEERLKLWEGVSGAISGKCLDCHGSLEGMGKVSICEKCLPNTSEEEKKTGVILTLKETEAAKQEGYKEGFEEGFKAGFIANDKPLGIKRGKPLKIDNKTYQEGKDE